MGVGAPLAERFDGRGWSLEPIPSPADAKASLLFGVSCVSSAGCIAVGSVTSTAGVTVPLAERWNGRRWIVQRTPELGSNRARVSYLAEISCASRRDCVAVGYSGNSAGTTGVPLMEAWNGVRWRVQESPHPSGARVGFLSGVSCTSSRSCIAVGFFIDAGGVGKPLVERWNGTRWGMQRAPSPQAAVGLQLVGVSCARDGSCMTAGFFSIVTGIEVMLAERWNGNVWSLQRTLYPDHARGVRFTGVACPSPGACTAVGFFENVAGSNQAFSERWNGVGWAIQPMPSPTGAAATSLAGVSCSSANQCTAVGSSINGAGAEVTLAERYS
jgi:hypothetical protein